MVFIVFYNIILTIIQCALFVQCMALFSVDQLERYFQNSDNEWKCQPNGDIQGILPEQIVILLWILLAAMLFLNYLVLMILKQNLKNYFSDRSYLF